MSNLGFTREEIAKYYYGTPQNVSQNTQSIPKLNPQPSTQLPPINNPNIPDDETRMKARNYIQTVYESQDDVSTPELKPINNPNIPDNETRMQARNFIQAAYNGDIDENGALVSQNKPSNDSSRKKTTQNKSTSAPFSTKENVKTSTPLDSKKYGKGNIDLTNRPRYVNEDGSISTVRSMSFNEDGKEILVPTVAYDSNGQAILLSDEEAIDRYHKTGEYLGKFNTIEEANRYANELHRSQEKMLDVPKDNPANKIGNYYAQKEKYLAKNATTSKYAEQKKIYEENKKKKEQGKLSAEETKVENAPTYGSNMFLNVNELNKQTSPLPTPTPNANELFNTDLEGIKEKANSVQTQDHFTTRTDTTRQRMIDKVGEDTINNLVNDLSGVLNNGGNSREKILDNLLDNNTKEIKDSLTKDEYKSFRKEVKARYREQFNQKVEDKARSFATENPALGTLASFGRTALMPVESLGNISTGFLTDDKRDLDYQQLRARQASREGAKSNIDSTIGQAAYDLGTGLGDFGVSVGTGAVTGLPTMLPSALNTAEEAQNRALENGSSVRKASAFGTGAGIADYVLNTRGLNFISDKLTSETVKTVGQALKNIGVGALTEGGENLAQEVVENVLDNIINGENSEIRNTFGNYIADGKSAEDAFKQTAIDTAKNLGMAFGTGALMGGAFAEGKMAINDIKNPRNVIPRVAENTPTDLPTNRLVENAPQNNADRANLAQNNVVNEIPTMKENVVNEPLNDSASVTETITPTDVNDSTDVEPLRVATEAVNHRQLNANMNSLLNMFGRRSEENVGQLRALLNEYAQTGDENTIKEARSLAKEIDKDYDGAKYTSKKGTVTEYGYGNFGKFSDQVDMFQNALKNQSALSKTSLTPGMEDLNGRINDLFSRYDLSDDVSKDIRKWKQSIKNLANETNGDNFDNYFDATSKLFDDIRESKEFVSSYRGKVKANDFDVPEYMAINDAIEDMYRNKSFPKSMAEDIGLKNDNTLTVDMSDIPPMDETDITSGKKQISKWRTNTSEKVADQKGFTDKLPDKSDYEYDVFSEDAANTEAINRYANSKDVAKDLTDKAQFDNVDVKAAMNEWTELMEKGDPESLEKAAKLSRKMSYEGREGGRVVQAFAEYSRNTPTGQLRQAKKAINDAVDEYAGKGTAEALDNLALKIQDLLDSGKSKEEIAQELSDMLNENLRKYAPTNKDMQPKKIKGGSKIVDMFKNNAAQKDILNELYKQNKGVTLNGQEELEVYNILKRAFGMKDGSREQEIAFSKAARIIKNKMPESFGDKFRSLIYANMLGNFKTAVSRNAFGNLGYQVLEQSLGAKSPIAALVDRGVSLFTKQHSATGWNKDKTIAYLHGAKKGLFDQAKDIVQRVDTGRSGELGWDNALKNASRSWDKSKTGVAGTADNLLHEVSYYVQNAMELGDRPFYEANYEQNVTELNQLLGKYGQEGTAELAGLNPEDIADAIDIIASVRAADSVFQKHGKISKGLTSIRNGLGDMSRGMFGVDILSTSASPFTMTPGNMIERAIEYSPLGIIKNIAETIREVKSANFNQRRFVDEAARTIGGIPVLAGAYALANNAIINGGYSDDPDEKQAQMDDGFIEYGFNNPINGKTYDTSDIPVLGPFMQAAAAINENGLNAKSLLQAPEAIIGGSATQGIRKIAGADTPSYSSNASVMDNIVNTLGSALGQLVPSVVRQTAQTTDKYKRDLGEYGTGQYYWNMFKNNIPIVRETMPAKIDSEGELVEQNQGRPLPNKILENYILPMNVSEYSPSALNQEATRLSQEAGTTMGFAPKAKRSDLRKWDESANIAYDEQQFRNYKYRLGELNSRVGEAVINSDYYNGLSDEKKAQTLSDVYSAMKAVAKYKSTGILGDNKLAATYLNSGVNGVLKTLEAQNNEYGLSADTYNEMVANGASEEEMREAGERATTLKDLGMTDESKSFKAAYKNNQMDLYEDYREYLKDNDMRDSEEHWGDYQRRRGIQPAFTGAESFGQEKKESWNRVKRSLPNTTEEEFSKTFDEMDRDGYGSITQDEFIRYLIREKYTDEAEAQKLAKAYGGWKKIPVLEDKKWKFKKKK